VASAASRADRSRRAPAVRGLASGLAAALALLCACAHGGPAGTPEPELRDVVRRPDPDRVFAPDRLPPARRAFLDTLERRTFHYFWDLGDTAKGLTPDRWPTRSFCSVGAVGFGLTAYPIGAERGWVSRAAAARRTLATLEFFWGARQDTARVGSTGYRGFFYHFIDASSGVRFRDVELSTIDTALLLAGALFCQSYFDRDDPAEARVRALAESLYARADWTWAMVRPPRISHGWTPEEGFLLWDWGGMNESMIVPILALGSPTHPATPSTWSVWVSTCRWGTSYGQAHVGFAPLFGHQYSQVWLDLRGIRDSLMRAHDLDWFENSRRATLAQRAYAIENPRGFRGYGPRLWGLTACDGPLNGKVTIEGRERTFSTYEGRGASFDRITDDGTVAPAAAGGSIVFTPGLVIPLLEAIREDHPHAWSTYGFVDALNPTLNVETKIEAGVVVPGTGWYDSDWLGIDQGPILAMTENYRTGLVWRTLRKNRHVVKGLRAAGFTGGWLDSATVGR
jgi:hypothetical protein